MITIEYFKKVCKDTLGENNCRFEYVKDPPDGDIYIVSVQCWYKDENTQFLREERKVASIFVYEDGSSLVCVKPYGKHDSYGTEWRFKFKRLMKKHTLVYRKYDRLMEEMAMDFKNIFANTEESIYFLFKTIYGTEWGPAAYQMASNLLETMRLRDRKATIEGGDNAQST
jgi:hypothetical protein